MIQDPLELITSCIELSKPIFKKYINENQTPELSYKTNKKDLVTNFDRQIESLYIEHILKNDPKAVFLAEESQNKSENSQYITRDQLTTESPSSIWVIDPIDGTSNFFKKYPYFCTTIGLAKKNTQGFYECHYGAVYDPNKEEYFVASKGNGATLNGNPIQCSSCHDLENALLCTGFAGNRYSENHKNFERFQKLTKASLGVRRAGAAVLDLCYVACGRLDGFWENGLSAWDMAVGDLLVSEANGLCSTMCGNNWTLDKKDILVANSRLHKTLKTQLNSV